MTDQRRTIALAKLVQTELTDCDVAEAVIAGGYLDHCELILNFVRKKYKAVLINILNGAPVDLIVIISCTLYTDLIEHMTDVRYDHKNAFHNCAKWLKRLRTRGSIASIAAQCITLKGIKKENATQPPELKLSDSSESRRKINLEIKEAMCLFSPDCPRESTRSH